MNYPGSMTGETSIMLQNKIKKMDAVFIEFMENLWKIETLIYFVFPSRLYILEKYLSNKYFFRKKRKYVDNWLHFLVLPQRPTSYLHVISMIIFPITLMEEMAGSRGKGHEAGRCEGQADTAAGEQLERHGHMLGDLLASLRALTRRFGSVL